MQHGGALSEAAERHGIGLEDWLDLSTGINPVGYPLPPVPETAWRRLPLTADIKALEASARRAYGVPAEAAIVSAPGTQALIQWLPYVRPAKRVAVVGPTYAEHAARWMASGARVDRVSDVSDLAGLDAEVMIVTNPNNPDGRIHDPERLSAMATALEARGGLLIVDEAFCDLVPDASAVAATARPGICVLRSVGKFYGLAGIRVGFALTQPDLASGLRDALGAWAVPGPSARAATVALNDSPWANRERKRLEREARSLDTVLAKAGLRVVGGTLLFRLVDRPNAGAIAKSLAQSGILVRHFDDAPHLLRFGLPPDNSGLARLEAALRGILNGQDRSAR